MVKIQTFLRNALRIWLPVWRSAVFVAAVVGVIYIWPDIKEMPTKFGFPAWEFPMWFDRELVGYCFLGIALLWIFWMDVRPSVREWHKRRASKKLIINDYLPVESCSIKGSETEAGPTLYLNTFYLPVGNADESGETMRRVQARIFFIGPPALCCIRDSGGSEADIRHGEWVYYKIGSLVSDKILGTFMKTIEVSEEDLKVTGAKGRAWGRGDLAWV